MPYKALAVNILVFGLYAVGFNLLFGYTGLLSFGHAAFLGVGATSPASPSCTVRRALVRGGPVGVVGGGAGRPR